MSYYVAGIAYGNDLYHHGIKGQKWGIRRYQNPDGTLTEAGKKRYGTVEKFNEKQKQKEIRKDKINHFISQGIRLLAMADNAVYAKKKSEVLNDKNSNKWDKTMAGIDMAFAVGDLYALSDDYQHYSNEYRNKYNS